MKLVLAAFISLLLVSNARAGMEAQMRYTKITGTFLKFESGKRLDTGVSYASQELRLVQHEFIVHTFANGKQIKTQFLLQGPHFLDFVAKTDDPSIPDMSGHFLNSDYEECILNATLPDQNVTVSGVVTKLDQLHALSTKIVTEITTGKVIGIMQEKIELISEDTFKTATNQD
jgi:hypothetical protein